MLLNYYILFYFLVLRPSLIANKFSEIFIITRIAAHVVKDITANKILKPINAKPNVGPKNLSKRYTNPEIIKIKLNIMPKHKTMFDITYIVLSARGFGFNSLGAFTVKKDLGIQNFLFD